MKKIFCITAFAGIVLNVTAQNIASHYENNRRLWQIIYTLIVKTNCRPKMI